MPLTWTKSIDVWLRHHADDGAEVLAELLDVPTSDLIDHALDMGIDIPPRPLMGDVCPWCGERMTPHSEGYASGVCSTCYRKHLIEARRRTKEEREAHQEDRLERLSAHRQRKKRGQSVSVVRKGDTEKRPS